MARKARVEFEGAVYHVLDRGDRREPIFKDDTDRRRFLETLAEVRQRTGWRVHAYVLMLRLLDSAGERLPGSRLEAAAQRDHGLDEARRLLEMRLRYLGLQREELGRFEKGRREESSDRRPDPKADDGAHRVDCPGTRAGTSESGEPLSEKCLKRITADTGEMPMKRSEFQEATPFPPLFPLMKESTDWDDFKRRLNRHYPIISTTELGFDVELLD